MVGDNIWKAPDQAASSAIRVMRSVGLTRMTFGCRQALLPERRNLAANWEEGRSHGERSLV